MEIETREQFERYVRKEIEDNTTLLPPRYDELFVELLLNAFDISAAISTTGKAVVKDE